MAETVPEYNIITGRRNNSFPKVAIPYPVSKYAETDYNQQTNSDAIAKAQPKRFSEMYMHNMPDLHNVDDIPEQSQVLHASLNKPSLGYTNTDISDKQSRIRLEHHGASIQTIRLQPCVGGGETAHTSKIFKGSNWCVRYWRGSPWGLP